VACSDSDAQAGNAADTDPTSGLKMVWEFVLAGVGVAAQWTCTFVLASVGVPFWSMFHVWPCLWAMRFSEPSFVKALAGRSLFWLYWSTYAYALALFPLEVILGTIRYPQVVDRLSDASGDACTGIQCLWAASLVLHLVVSIPLLYWRFETRHGRLASPVRTLATIFVAWFQGELFLVSVRMRSALWTVAWADPIQSERLSRSLGDCMGVMRGQHWIVGLVGLFVFILVFRVLRRSQLGP